VRSSLDGDAVELTYVNERRLSLVSMISRSVELSISSSRKNKWEISTVSLDWSGSGDGADWSTIRSGIKRTLDSRFVMSKLMTNLLGTVLSPLLRQKMRRRKALAAMAMTDDVTKPAPINQWVSASIYRLQEENEQMKGNARAHSHLFWFWEAPTKHE
jgi:hypothetical protein